MGHWPDALPRLSEAEFAAIRDGLTGPWARLSDILNDRVVRSTWPPSTRNYGRSDHIEQWTPADIRRALLAYHLRACDSGRSGRRADTAVLRYLLDRSSNWSRDELLFALHVAADALPITEDTDYLETPIGIAGRMDPSNWSDLRLALSSLFAWLEQQRQLNSAGHSYLIKALGQALDGDSGMPRSVLHRGDAFGPMVRARHDESLRAPGVGALFVHCANADKPVPTKKWSTELSRLLEACPTGRGVARAVFAEFVASPQYLHADTDRLLRGLAWILTDDGGVLVARATVATSSAGPRSTGYPFAPLAAPALVTILGRAVGELPARTLASLSIAVKNKALNGRIRTALAELGARRGWSPGEVLEIAVDEHGLDPDGALTRHVGGEYVATIQISEGKARLAFAQGGQSLAAVPAAIKQDHEAELKALKTLVKDIDTTLASQRQRLEGLLSEERQWPYDAWVRRMIEHPVVGTFGRSLIYEATVDGAMWTSGLPVRVDDGWNVVRYDGSAIRGTTIRLWHPIRATIPEIQAWRAHLVDTGCRQPFKQAFREVYLLTPAEEQTQTYSNRFAAHVLHYRQANALMRARGWRANYLGSWDGGYNGTATKELAAGTWRASFHHSLVEDDGRRGARLCATDQVRFERRDGATWQPATVLEVPPVVLSEAMRDVDLFVGVTSIAADPEWVDRGDNRFTDYWHSVAFGSLTATAQLRHDALARLLPRTKIADQVELEDKFLRVRGRLRTYRIHLGSGNILMSPNDAYLCIVAARGKNSALRLPFEDDPMLSMILSKAFLLAADNKITDASILRQIRLTDAVGSP
jgi:hypothetical protein